MVYKEARALEGVFPPSPVRINHLVRNTYPTLNNDMIR